MKLLILVLLTFTFFPVQQDQLLTITLKNNTAAEKSAQAQLERITKTYDVTKWIFTFEVVINDDDFIPHSHPKLTLNSRYLADDLKQLSTFLHEEIHWWAEGRSKEIELAIEDFKKIYPQVPTGKEGGAHDTYSTYLHLVVCHLELEAMRSLVGEAQAIKVMSEWQHYRWIYDKVLNDPVVKKINEKYGLRI
ncbi:MAG: hypothetical protein ACOYXT_03240 [Bacteroidota bacterium]